MKDYDTERARQERDSVAAGMMTLVASVAAFLLLLVVAIPFEGRVVVLLAVAAVAVVVTARHVRDAD